MNKSRYLTIGVGATLALLGCMHYSSASYEAGRRMITPANMPRIGTVDERFQSYNVEMVEVIGGRFWKPYKDVNALLKKSQPSAKQPGSNPVGMDPNLYQYRPPIDLTKPRLRRLAAALGPAYVRVSGTWANTVYFQDLDTPAPASPPKGFNGVLTRREWRGVVDFSHAVDAEIVTSFATSPGTRNSAGVWTPEPSRRLLAYTTSIGGSIAAAEFMNEPTYAAMGGAPKGYDAAAYGRDIAVFSPFIKHAAPELTFLGPVFDVFSYHLYPAVSERCASMGASAQTTAAAALSEEWLNRIDTIDTYYADLRDKFEPGKPLWITETADAACGGNQWASTFLDSFRYLDQHGRLAKRGVKVIMHNTLASSDYGLLDENTLAPRPNYWASLLWRKFMGTTVLDAGPSPAPTLHLYAHCLRGQPGGIALLAINTDRSASHSLNLTTPAERYTLSVPSVENLEDTHVQLNGTALKLGADDAIPRLSGMPTGPGPLTLAPASITFVAIPKADNASCR